MRVVVGWEAAEVVDAEDIVVEADMLSSRSVLSVVPIIQSSVTANMRWGAIDICEYPTAFEVSETRLSSC